VKSRTLLLLKIKSSLSFIGLP